MKRLFFYFIIVFTSVNISAQSIPYGCSIDTLQVAYSRTFYNTPPFINDSMKEVRDTIVYSPFEIYYYKPNNYNPLTSAVLWGIHGIGGSGNSEVVNLQNIADRRNTLIVSVTMKGAWWDCYVADGTQMSPNLYYYYFAWYQEVFKQIYQHVLGRENRNAVPVYLIGWSAGAQCVTRYMLIRQGVPDSIPIMMALSVNPHSYTYCTDTLDSVHVYYQSLDTMYYKVPMYYDCGLLGSVFGSVKTSEFNCNAHVIQYYNENYAMLIGSADTAQSWFCTGAQGPSRYERAKNFYAFSYADAIERGTTLTWQFDSIQGVGHSQSQMYNNILPGDSMPLAERLLFETPYHIVPQTAPYANFTADTTIVTLPSATVQFYNSSINTTSYLWDFGDSDTSILSNPSHTYSYVDTFTVRLTANSGTGCENTIIKRNYIIVKLPNGVESYNYNNSVNIFPNPATNELTLDFALTDNSYFELFDMMGAKRKAVTLDKGSHTIKIDLTDIDCGVYFYSVVDRKGNRIKTGKLVVIK